MFNFVGFFFFLGSSLLPCLGQKPFRLASASRGSPSPLPSPVGVSGMADSFDVGSAVPGSGHLPHVANALITEPFPPTFSSLYYVF